MILPSLLLLAATASAIAAPPALDTTLVAGLAVTIERIPEPIAVDGVLMSVQRVTGAGVPELARRIETAWHRQGSRVEARQQESWIVRSRIHGSRSEVLQWRADARDAELLLSSVALQEPIRRLPATGLTLPASCNWGRSITGSTSTHSFVQRSARCPHSRQTLSLQLREVLSRQGWNIRTATDSGLVVERAGLEGFIGLSIQEAGAATWVSWLRVERNP
jgi:hypothetical protein